MNIEAQLEANQNRRMANQARAIAKFDTLADREAEAREMVGELCRNGKTVYYINLRNGKTKEFTNRYDAADYLIRNRYV